PARRLEMRSDRAAIFLGCRSHTDEAIHLVAELGSDHRLALRSEGKHDEHTAIEHVWIEGDIGHDDCDQHDEAHSWATRWTGHWRQQRDTLTLELVLASDTCTGTCSAASRRTRVTCKSERAPLGDALFPAEDVAVWRCTGRGLGESPERWVFGATSCIAV